MQSILEAAEKRGLVHSVLWPGSQEHQWLEMFPDRVKELKKENEERKNLFFY